MRNGAPEAELYYGNGNALGHEFPVASLTPILQWLCHDSGLEGAFVLRWAQGQASLIGAAGDGRNLADLARAATLFLPYPEHAVTTTEELGLALPARGLRLVPLEAPDEDVLLCLFTPEDQTEAPPEPCPEAVEALSAHLELLLERRRDARSRTGHVAHANLLQQTIDGLDDPLCTCDGQGRILSANRALSRLLGQERQELVGRNLATLLCEDDVTVSEFLQPHGSSDSADSTRTWRLQVPLARQQEVTLRKTLLHHDGHSQRMLLRWYATGAACTSLQDARTVILERIARREPVTSTLSTICEIAENQWPGSMTIVSVPKPEGGRLLVAPSMTEHFRHGLETHHRFEPDESLCATVVNTGERHICPDVRMEDRWPDYGWFAVAHGIHSVWGEPLITRDGNTVGAITVFHRQAGQPNNRQLDVMQRLADLAALAVSHANFLEELESHAFHDGLTGLPNRRLLSDRLRHQLGLARRTRRPVAVMLLDVDGFKQVNDERGHDEGDRLLCRLSEHLAAVLRPGDTLARLGGDEFVVIAGIARNGDAAAVAEKLLAAAARMPSELPVGLSIGISLFPDHGDSERPLLHRADRAMYQAKEHGKNRWCIYSPARP
ncbi:diguanylate cyclase domain-containing protein [Aquisalimonas asiatica]|uniref:PAS domain S-box-containing protein/diguanylate cyclase (GGDEF) domain-containing protein n=1 Tax=Aquisalimonas asiatica TaxID=406100 RepID=A0A1H8VAT5_9GAMM|nr:diguanylate cyclase [Aquisalimonas asiatica]SEP12560.1 PAS domain S-box-containing protein/diguanylate cyclase (GGDEF) domain-containing protein [Aquisalimonas asiatica]